jgi:hypothetical protein
MPGFMTYHNFKNIYSVDMMLSYINVYGHPIVKLPIDTFIPQLKEKVWGEWSPMDVLEKMDMKKYKHNAERIRPPLIINERLGMPPCDILMGYLWSRTVGS